MITIARLRQRIDEARAWGDLRDALGLEISAQQLRNSIEERQILHAFGGASVGSPRLRQKLHAYAMPDVEEIGQYSDSNLLYYLGAGLTNARDIGDSVSQFALSSFTSSSPAQLSILDFGCGLARILRYLVQFAPDHRYYACDVNQPAVEWGKRVFPEVSFLHIQSSPPLPLPDSSIDVAYAWSIFTHYAEELHRRWLAELARLLKPGGLLIVTVHGRTILGRMTGEKHIRDAMRVGNRNVGEVEEEFETRGYAFYECYLSERAAPRFGIDASTFGMAFISPEYVTKHWTPSYEVLQYDLGRVSDWQDYVVLRRK